MNCELISDTGETSDASRKGFQTVIAQRELHTSISHSHTQESHRAERARNDGIQRLGWREANAKENVQLGWDPKFDICRPLTHYATFIGP